MINPLKPTLLCSALALAQAGGACAAPVVPQQFAPLTTVSPELSQFIMMPPVDWDVHPQSAEQWEELVQSSIPLSEQLVDHLCTQYELTVTPETIAGVPCFRITPPHQPQAKQDQVLLYLHCGGYVLNPGKAGLVEALPLAGIGGYTIIAVDYRMAPQHPYPAAIDDAFAVYQELLQTTPASQIGIFGSSSGGAMSLIVPMMCQEKGIAQPSAVMAGTPWSDLNKIGDTYFSHEGVDQTMVSYEGWLKDAVRVYAGDHDLKDPHLSPVYGDYSNFPPLLLIAGTRDLFLSNTVRVQAKMLAAKRPVELIVYEGISHAQYFFFPDVPETKQHYRNVTAFFERYLQ